MLKTTVTTTHRDHIVNPHRHVDIPEKALEKAPERAPENAPGKLTMDITDLITPMVTRDHIHIVSRPQREAIPEKALEKPTVCVVVLIAPTAMNDLILVILSEDIPEKIREKPMMFVVVRTALTEVLIDPGVGKTKLKLTMTEKTPRKLPPESWRRLAHMPGGILEHPRISDKKHS